MIIRRKHVSNKAGNPTNDWDIEIKNERHETVEDNGNIVIDDRKRTMYLATKNYNSYASEI
ncbi:MAG: hypothetical protein J6C15_09800 [Bacteroidaceae bacterium]|nr:hypothetical protein [Bacteroidaceae bacterium]